MLRLSRRRRFPLFQLLSRGVDLRFQFPMHIQPDVRIGGRAPVARSSLCRRQ